MKRLSKFCSILDGEFDSLCICYVSCFINQVVMIRKKKQHEPMI